MTSEKLGNLPLKDNEELRQALEAADVRALVMTYVHLSRDEEMLDRFAPALPSASLGMLPNPSDELLADLRGRVLALLTTPGAAAKGPISVDLLNRIMSVGMGEPVDPEFIPLLLEQTGLGPQPDRSGRPARKRIPADYKALIIGAGLTGMAAAIKLDEAGYPYEIVEKNPEIGGTWWSARYPGVGVDTPSHFYSYSFELNPDWTTYTPSGGEMQGYLAGVASKYGLRDRTRFNTMVTTLRWIEADGQWEVTMRGKDGAEETRRYNVVINAHGPISRWEWPKIAGLEDFQGVKMHTGAWDPAVELKGKRVALIGTGASAAQCGPAIAGDVANLTVFMRSGHWVLPNHIAGLPVPDPIKWAMRHIPYYLEWFRFSVYWTGSDGLYPNLLMDPDWHDKDLTISAANAQLRDYCMHNMHVKLAGRPDLIEKLTPDAPVFSKRIVMDTNWLPMFMRDNVALETTGIERITPKGIRTVDGVEHEFDVILFATGYNLARMTGSLEIIGRDGRNLGEEWGEEDPEAYFGLTVPGYPNYFHMTGPNSGPNHGAGINLLSEAQVHYVIECLDHLVETGHTALEPTRAACDAFNARVQGQMPNMIWSHPKAKTYYKNSKGKVIVSWPFRLVDYWNESRSLKLADYQFHGVPAETEAA
ncbi:NAD(P)-binding protein [Sphingobium sp.]|uniref:NAD(P)-binding protein n=1 Tax=Sphingobium sp. TaxID=1912891 RepID=UPI0035C6F375